MSAFAAWQKDIPEDMGDIVKAAEEERNATPTASQILASIYCGMSFEILVRVKDKGHSKDQPAEQQFIDALNKDVSGLAKFMSGHLGLAKKDVDHAQIYKRLEKLQKASAF